MADNADQNSKSLGDYLFSVVSPVPRGQGHPLPRFRRRAQESRDTTASDTTASEPQDRDGQVRRKKASIGQRAKAFWTHISTGDFEARPASAPQTPSATPEAEPSPGVKRQALGTRVARRLQTIGLDERDYYEVEKTQEQIEAEREEAARKEQAKDERAWDDELLAAEFPDMSAADRSRVIAARDRQMREFAQIDNDAAERRMTPKEAEASLENAKRLAEWASQHFDKLAQSSQQVLDEARAASSRSEPVESPQPEDSTTEDHPLIGGDHVSPSDLDGPHPTAFRDGVHGKSWTGGSEGRPFGSGPGLY